MSFLGLSRDDMRKVLSELDQALFNHEQWSEAMSRTLICRLAPDQADLADEAHRRCRFGQWLYSPSTKGIASHPGLAEIVTAHERMHRSAGEMLKASTRGEVVELPVYERFVNAMKQLRLEIHTIRHELEDAVFNLDPLTGAANRIGMLTKLREQQSLVQRKVHFCCLAMLDLDHFRAVNEQHGHATGDRVLATFARHVMDHLRHYDSMFRYGGEEFLICLPDTDLKTAIEVVGRLGQTVADLSFKTNGGAPFHITVSGWITLLDADVSVEESIDRADKALYAAKAGGRNRVVAWDVSMV